MHRVGEGFLVQLNPTKSNETAIKWACSLAQHCDVAIWVCLLSGAKFGNASGILGPVTLVFLFLLLLLLLKWNSRK